MWSDPRAALAELYGAELADARPRALRRLGEVEQHRAAIMAEPDVDGGLVGGASLDPEEFAKIARFSAHVTASVGPAAC